jgi:hypothetical protein
MIRVNEVRNLNVSDAKPGDLILFAGAASGETVFCIPVKYSGSMTLLALHFPNGSFGKFPLLLKNIAEQPCIALGQAEFQMASDLKPVSYGSGGAGLLVFGPQLTITGRIDAAGRGNIMDTYASWVISTGEMVSVHHAALCAGAWEVGLRNTAGAIEPLFQFPSAQ